MIATRRRALRAADLAGAGAFGAQALPGLGQERTSNAAAPYLALCAAR
jgi:hypothetical protein